MKLFFRIGLSFVAALVVVVALFGSFVLGMHRQSQGLWPVTPLQNIKLRLTHSPIQYDDHARLVAFPGKQQVDCPAQAPQAAVLLVFGQSNSANSHGQRFRALDNRVLNFFGGKCYLAESPLLGAGGDLGESWTLLGNKLVAANLFQQIIVIPAGVGGTPIRRWAAGGDLNRMLVDVINDVAPFYKITHVLWHQGESDFLNGTTEAAYVADFHSIVGTLKALKVSAPIYVSKASYWPSDRSSPGFETARKWEKGNPVTAAQTKLPDGKTIFAGPDTDADISALDRYDGIHFSGCGQEIFATRWLEILKP